MLCAKTAGNRAGMLAFVISFAAWKHDCESLEPARVLRHQSCKQAGVDAATQEHAYRDIRNHLPPYRLSEYVSAFFDPLSFRPLPSDSPTGQREVEVPRNADSPIFYTEIMTRLWLVDTIEDCHWRNRVTKCQ